MSQAISEVEVLKQKEKEVATTMISWRSELSRMLRQLWGSPEGMKVRALLSMAARVTKFADKMKTIMAQVKDQIKEAADTTIKEEYYCIWHPEDPTCQYR